jgi:hypothetical protein
MAETLNNAYKKNPQLVDENPEQKKLAKLLANLKPPVEQLSQDNFQRLSS